MWKFNLLYGSWVPVLPTNKSPGPRAYASAVVLTISGVDQMVVAGGRLAWIDFCITAYSDLWAFNPANQTWTNLTETMKGEVTPQAVWGHTAVAMNGSMYMFGGALPATNCVQEPGASNPFGLFTSTDDVVVYHPEGNYWSRPTKTDPWIFGRGYHVAAALLIENEPVMMAAGGLCVVPGAAPIAADNYSAFSSCADTWYYSPRNNTWRRLSAAQGLNLFSSSPAAVTVQSGQQLVWVFGGMQSVADFMALNASDGKLQVSGISYLWLGLFM